MKTKNVLVFGIIGIISFLFGMFAAEFMDCIAESCEIDLDDIDDECIDEDYTEDE